jgi:hypothetical protein
MKRRPRLSRWPYALFAALSLVSFGGPFLVMVVVWGGASPYWPPDRPLEWLTIALVLGLFAVLFIACLTNGWWDPPPRFGKAPPLGDTSRPDRPFTLPEPQPGSTRQ